MANHGWVWTRGPALRPQRCAVFPHISASMWIDTGIDIQGYDPHVYISDVAAKELGKMVGMVAEQKLTLAKRELSEAKDEISRLKNKVEELERFKDAVQLIKAEANA